MTDAQLRDELIRLAHVGEPFTPDERFRLVEWQGRWVVAGYDQSHGWTRVVCRAIMDVPGRQIEAQYDFDGERLSRLEVSTTFLR